MNFQAIDQASGKNVKIWATLFVWESIAFTPNQAKYLSCKLRDDDGVEHKCRIYEGKGSLPGQENLNKRLEFSLSCYQGTTQQNQPYTGYSGFWSHGATTSAPQNTQQAPSQPAQATNYQPPAQIQVKKEPDWDAIAEEKVRCNVLCAMLQGGITVDYPEVLEHTAFIMSGIDTRKIPEPDQSIQNNPDYVGDGQEGICPHCQKPLEDCTCDIKF